MDNTITWEKIENYIKSNDIEDLANVGDLAEISAINRPGPLGMDLNSTWLDSKNNKLSLDVEGTFLSLILKRAFGQSHTGFMIFQEDVMRYFIEAHGFSMVDSDNVRRAMGKKIASILESYKGQFDAGIKYKYIYKINGQWMLPDQVGKTGITAEECYNKTISENKKNGKTLSSNTLDRKEINYTKLWDFILNFASYGFNKSHSVAYSQVGFQTAYLWTHHRNEFLAWMMNSGILDKKKAALEEAKLKGYKIVYPTFDKMFCNNEYIIEDKTIYVPVKIDEDDIQFLKPRFNGINEILFDNSIPKKTRTALILMGIFDEVFPHREALALINKSLSKKAYTHVYNDCTNTDDVLNAGAAVGLWSIDESRNTDTYSVIFIHHAKKEDTELVVYKRKDMLDPEAIEFNIKQDIKFFGISRDGTLDDFYELDTDTILLKYNKLKERVINNFNEEFAEEIESGLVPSMYDVRNLLKRELKKTLFDDMCKSQIESIENSTYKVKFIGAKNRDKYVTVTLQFDNIEKSFYINKNKNTEELYNTCLGLTKNRVYEISIEVCNYINKNFDVVFTYRLKTIK